MTDTESDLRRRLEQYVAPAPPLHVDAAEITRRGTRDRRRRLATRLAGGTALAVVAALGTVVAVDGHDGPAGPTGADGRSGTPSATGPAPGAQPAVLLASSTEDMPVVLRAFARDVFPGSHETAVRASNWTMTPDSYDGLRSLPRARWKDATSWDAQFVRGTDSFDLVSLRIPPDEPAALDAVACQPATADYRCVTGHAPDGRPLVESWTRVRADGQTRLEHLVVVRGHGLEADAEEVQHGVARTASLTAGFDVSSAQLRRIAADRRMSFPLPDTPPALPSSDYCIYGDVAPGTHGCPAPR